MELDLENGEPIALPRGERIVERRVRTRRSLRRCSAHGFAVVSGVTVSRVTSTEETARGSSRPRRAGRIDGGLCRAARGASAPASPPSRCAASRIAAARASAAAGISPPASAGLQRVARRAVRESCAASEGSLMASLHARLFAVPERHVHLRRADQRLARRRARSAARIWPTSKSSTRRRRGGSTNSRK